LESPWPGLKEVFGLPAARIFSKKNGLPYAGQSHAAPRTPDESPCLACTMFGEKLSEKT
jgi:hypothetical protein